jgi:hypothetical protein
VVALDAVMSRLESVEGRLRRAETDRVSALADAFDVIAVETGAPYGSVPTGTEGELAYRALRAEIAMVTEVTERTAERHLQHAFQLRHQYRLVDEIFNACEISYRHTTVIVEAGAIIGSGNDIDTLERRLGYENAVLPHALQETPARLAPIARRLAEQFAERSLDERHEEARQRRRIWVEPQSDGMADLIAHLPAAEAMGIFDRVTRIAKRIERSERAAASAAAATGAAASVDARPQPTDAHRGRTRDQIRADVLVYLATQGVPPTCTVNSADVGSGSGNGAGFGVSTEFDVSAGTVYTAMNLVTAQVQIVIPVDILGPETAAMFTPVRPPGTAPPGTAPPCTAPPGTAPLGTSQPEADALEGPPHLEPAFLSGYGPIDDTSARRLASSADHWETERIDESSGVILSVDRYRPTESMRRYLAARDERCRFPGCTVQAARCDIDHTIDAALGGPTRTSNLAHLCRGHHALKHHSDWRVTQAEHGILEWTSPTGRKRIDWPPRRVMSRRGSEPPRHRQKQPAPADEPF